MSEPVKPHPRSSVPENLPPRSIPIPPRANFTGNKNAGPGILDQAIIRSPQIANPNTSLASLRRQNQQRVSYLSSQGNRHHGNKKVKSKDHAQSPTPVSIPSYGATEGTRIPPSATKRHRSRLQQTSGLSRGIHTPPSQPSPSPGPDSGAADSVASSDERAETGYQTDDTVTTSSMNGIGEKVAIGGYGYRWLYNTGSEPGVDVTKDPGVYRSLNTPVRVTVVDYDSYGNGTRVDVPGSKLKEWLESEDGQRPSDAWIKDSSPEDSDATEATGYQDPHHDDGTTTKSKTYKKTHIKPNAHAKSHVDEKPKSVRWINVDGINFSVLKTLTLKYDLHPLSVEDSLRASQNPRSKVDFYQNHLYLQCFLHYIKQGDQEEVDAEDFSVGATPGTGVGGGGTGTGTGFAKQWRKWLGTHNEEGVQSLPPGVEGAFEPVQSDSVGHGRNIKSTPQRVIIDQLSLKYMIPLRPSLMSVFMLRDGTVITMSNSECPGLVLDPIYLRLDQEDGLLRRNPEGSMLLQALLDVSVDLEIEVTKTFENEILKMEAGCLVNPQMEMVRKLFVITSQMARLKRALSPLSKVLYTLRDQDAQRALASMLYASSVNNMGEELASQRSAVPYQPLHSGGFITESARIYMSDVIDHLDTVISSFDQYTLTCEHLVSYIFDMLNFSTNSSMERLSLVTVIFLPLTFMAGYYGMNFEDFPSLKHSDGYFWVISGPLVAGFFVIFCWSYITSGLRTFGRIMFKRRHEDMLKRPSSSVLAAKRRNFMKP